MALVLGITKGKAFTVGGQRVEVSDIIDPTRFKIKETTPAMDYEQTVTPAKAVRLNTKPNVTISAGKNGTDFTARVVIDAPKTMEIERED